MFESLDIAFDNLRVFYRARDKICRTKTKDESRLRTSPARASIYHDRAVEHVAYLGTEMFRDRSVRRRDTIVVEQRFGFVLVIQDLDLQRIVRSEILSMDEHFYAAQKRRLEIDACLHQ